ncbi:zinc ribbon domain-containing protein [Desulfovibrio sp. OttesenSCG-928-F07]|nr:zinc ribbon domain-containing protein [Desulfovibrio sp. OttesenSCG-928-F07]
MPIFEFNCPKCQHKFEDLVFGSATPPCPKCGNAETEKMISRPTIHFAAPSRAGQTVTFPSSGGSGCGSCAGGNCGSCGS